MALCTYTSTIVRPIGADKSSQIGIYFDTLSAGAVPITDYTVQAQLNAALATSLATKTIHSSSLTAVEAGTDVTFTLIIECDENINIPEFFTNYDITLASGWSAVFTSTCSSGSLIPTPGLLCFYTASITRPTLGTTIFNLYFYYYQQNYLQSGDWSVANDIIVAEQYFDSLLGVSNTSLSFVESGSDVTITVSLTYDSSIGIDPLIAIQDTLYSGSFSFVCQNPPTGVTTCDKCYDIEFKACETSYTFSLGLLASTIYTIKMTDSLGNIYEQESTTDANGDIIWTTYSTEPTGLFNPYAGIYEFEFIDANSTIASFIVGDYQYYCVNATFTNNFTLN